MASTKDSTSAGAQGTTRTGPPLAAISLAVQKAPMLLHFLNEPKEESYFTGLQDHVPVSHGYRGSNFDNLALALASMLSEVVRSVSSFILLTRAC
jgi:hypothetical protein